MTRGLCIYVNAALLSRPTSGPGDWSVLISGDVCLVVDVDAYHTILLGY